MKSGDKAIVRLKPVKVTIRKAMPYWQRGYYCRKCGAFISTGSLYGYSRNGSPFCLKCCEPLDE